MPQLFGELCWARSSASIAFFSQPSKISTSNADMYNLMIMFFRHTENDTVRSASIFFLPYRIVHCFITNVIRLCLILNPIPLSSQGRFYLLLCALTSPLLWHISDEHWHNLKVQIASNNKSDDSTPENDVRVIFVESKINKKLDPHIDRDPPFDRIDTPCHSLK